MICADSIYLDDVFTEGRRFVDDELQKAVWGRFSCQEFKLVVDGTRPGCYDAQ